MLKCRFSWFEGGFHIHCHESKRPRANLAPKDRHLKHESLQFLTYIRISRSVLYLQMTLEHHVAQFEWCNGRLNWNSKAHCVCFFFII